MALWIRGGRLVDPLNGTVMNRDIIIEGDRIARILRPGEWREGGPFLEVVDIAGKLLLPGLVDMHVHFREPGQEYKETIATGARAGIAGGFTHAACMPNTVPANDCGAVTRFMLERAREADLLRLFPVAAITRGREGVTLNDFGELREAGAVAVSDDGAPVADEKMMQKAMVAAADHGLAIISHCESLELSLDGVMHAGWVSERLGLKGIPALSEETMVAREISLSKRTRCPVHIAHVSTRGSVELIKKAKEDDLPVTAETAPHYFTLDHTAVLEYNTLAKMNPPLRTPEDVQAIKEGLAEDVIDVIATDHAPHSMAEKRVTFEEAAFGIIGLETAVPLTLALVREGILTLPAAVRKLSYNPAVLLGLEGGVLRAGGIADLTVVDPECLFSLREDDLQSKSKNTPFLGRPLKGRNLLTLVGGRIVWKRET